MKRTLKGHRLVFLVLAATVAGGLIASGAGQERSPLQTLHEAEARTLKECA